MLLTLSWKAAAQIDISHIEIISAADNLASRELTIKIQKELERDTAGIDITVRSKDAPSNNNPASVLVIAVGDSLLPWLNANKNNYLGAISFLSSASAFLEEEKTNRKLTAIYRDQPLARQLRLSKLLFPNLRHVAIIRSERVLPISIDNLERSSNVAITEAAIDMNTEWAKQLSQLMQSNDLLLGVEDAQIYNAESIRSILLTTYRHGRGLIGPSRAFVNAGSLASCYTLPDQYVQQLGDMVVAIIRERKLPHPQYPNQFRVALNKQVATSLNLSFPDENTLSAGLQDQKGECGDGC